MSNDFFGDYPILGSIFDFNHDRIMSLGEAMTLISEKVQCSMPTVTAAPYPTRLLLVIKFNIYLCSFINTDQLVDVDGVHYPVTRHALLLKLIYTVDAIDFP